MTINILACPGQGSQSVGFLIPWINQVAGFRSHLETLSAACEKDLVWLGTEADEEIIKDTANSQPLIVASGLAALRSSLRIGDFQAVVGHSVGEFTAAAAAGVLSDEDAVRLVSVRANAMAEAAAKARTSMVAILGGDETEVLSAIEQAGLAPANYNGAGQIVAAGLAEDVQKIVTSPPARSRAIELKVAGAFHTSYMESAKLALQSAMQEVCVQNPVLRLISNQSGQEISSGLEFCELLVSQVSNPVRWDKCMTTLNTEGSTFVELPPAGALAGLAKRGMPNTLPIALKTPEDIAKMGA